MHFFEGFDVACFRGDVKDLHLTLEYIRPLLEIEPDQPMTFQRLTARTQSIFAGSDSAVWKKFPEALSADRTMNLVSTVNKGEQLKAQS
jgi:hypothetical protein